MNDKLEAINCSSNAIQQKIKTNYKQNKAILNQLKTVPKKLSKPTPMSRKPSFETDLSISKRLNHSERLFSETNPSKNHFKEFDKYSSQVQDRNASQQTHHTTYNYHHDFSGLRKLPENISSIRETFSYNSLANPRSDQFNNYEKQITDRIAKGDEQLRQTMDVKSTKRKQNLILQRSVSGYLSPTYNSFNIRSEPTLQYSSKRPFCYEPKRYQIKSYSYLSKRNQKPLTIEQQIRHIHQQNHQRHLAQKHSQDILTSSYNRDEKKGFTNTNIEDKKIQNFAKKNYIEYYTPKVQKTHHPETWNQTLNVRSPQYTKQKKETSFEVAFHSPRKITDIKTIKENLKIKTLKRSKYQKEFTINDFHIAKSLGQGRFGTAHMAIEKQTGAVFAIKKVKKQVIKANKLIDQFILEVKLQSFLVHPFIVKVYGLFDDQEFIYIILQFMEQGTLFNCLKKLKKLTQRQTAQKIRYLAESIKYLQDRGIAHRDIKPQNIIISNDVCKLADFGWATFCDQERRKTYCGTCDYVAPEILQGHEYDESVDLWCIGIITFELMTGKAPFYHMSQKETKKKIINMAMTYPQDFSDDLKSFISKLIQKVPEERMSIEEVLQHPFINKINLSE